MFKYSRCLMLSQCTFWASSYKSTQYILMQSFIFFSINRRKKNQNFKRKMATTINIGRDLFLACSYFFTISQLGCLHTLCFLKKKIIFEIIVQIYSKIINVPYLWIKDLVPTILRCTCSWSNYQKMQRIGLAAFYYYFHCICLKSCKTYKVSFENFGK